MSDRVFTVARSVATPAQPVKLAEAGLRERADLQEWVIAYPEILGEDVRVVTFEFDRFRAPSGARARDRLDVLGIGVDGRLVVAELKRDRAPDTVEMQAVKYAAMVSRFTEDTLAWHHARFLSRDGDDVSEYTARQRLVEHAGDLDPELLRRPRIVLVASEFPPVVTATAVWLNEMGLDVTLQRVHAYRVPNDQIVVLVSQVFPVPEVEEFTVSPLRQQLQEAEDRRRTVKEQSTVVRLVAARSIPDGTIVFLRPTTEVSRDVRDMVQAWVAQDPRRGRARWYNDRRPLEWEYDEERYRPTAIVRRILAEAAGLQRSPRGPAWWVLEDGRDLPTVAGVPDRARFDWTELHEVLTAVPAGRWTTYGDLADLIGTAAQPLGQHIQTCPSPCPNPQRVLGADGTPRPGFVWTDPAETRSQQEALEAEGVPFPDGAAHPHLRLDAAGLAALIEHQ